MPSRDNRKEGTKYQALSYWLFPHEAGAALHNKRSRADTGATIAGVFSSFCGQQASDVGGCPCTSLCCFRNRVDVELLANLPFLSLQYVCACPCLHTDTHTYTCHIIFMNGICSQGGSLGWERCRIQTQSPVSVLMHYTTAPSSLISHVKEGYTLTHTEGV